tara:strand:- start:10188 stop:10364 length:177 start_codon:yes stop_codon:yes gene_type:complete
MSLDQLKALSENSEDSSDSEISISLEQLKGAIDDKSSSSGLKDQELSLDELRKFGKDN